MRFLLLLLLWAGPVLAAERLAGENQPFTLTEAKELAYCAAPTDPQCEWRLYQPGSYVASNAAWGKDPQENVAKAMWARAPTPAVPEEAWCWPLNPLAYSLVSVPVSTRYPRAIWFKDACNGKIRLQPFSISEAWDAIGSAASFTSSDAINDYRKSKPKTELNDVETRWYYDFIREKSPPVVEPPLPPPPVCKITQDGTKPDRPVYRLNADGTRNTTAVSGVRVAHGTPCGKRYGITNYFSVQGQLDTQGRPMGDVYAIGALVP